MKQRRKQVLQSVPADALLVTVPSNVRYLSGFTGSNGQLLVADDPVLFTDGRYTEQAAAESPDLERVIYAGGKRYEAILDALGSRGIRRLAFEAGHPEPGSRLSRDALGYVTVQDLEDMREAFKGIELVPTTGIVETARVRKDAAEVDAIRRAQRIAEDALRRALSELSGATETGLALAIEWAVRTSGADGLSFETIVASGPHAALPHAKPRDVPIATGLLLVDMGARVDGYCSDMTRTYFTGPVPEPLPRAHSTVVRAVEAACEAIRPGVACADVDRAAREVIEEEGFGEAFVHGTGHGVGLDIHELPRVAKIGQGVLEPGMVVTIEPGVYLPGLGGIRVEDLVVVSDVGAEVLTSLPRGPDVGF